MSAGASSRPGDTGPNDTARWPSGIARLLDGTDLESKVGITTQLSTVGTSGWTHVALLSVGEVVIDAPDGVRLAIWPTTSTSENLRRTGQGSLGLVHDGAWWLARLEVEATVRLDGLPTPLLGLRARLVELREDRAPYARLSAGLTFDLPEPDQVLARWRNTVGALLASPELDDQRS